MTNKSYIFPAMYIVVFFFFISNIALGTEYADFVLVKKSKHKLYLMKSGKIIKSFHIALGGNPKGAKQKQGDEKTPEGRYILDYKNAHSHYYKSIHISYPNASDRKRAKKMGVSPGGDIMIHGQKNGWEWLSFLSQRFNWTKGCIAVSNKDMDIIWKLVKVGTPIEIRP
jgi:murein L,D-transpeptidase YafK